MCCSHGFTDYWFKVEKSGSEEGKKPPQILHSTKISTQVTELYGLRAQTVNLVRGFCSENGKDGAGAFRMVISDN